MPSTRSIVFLVFLFEVLAGCLQISNAQSLCDIPKLAGVGLGPPDTTDAKAILGFIAGKAGFDPDKYKPFPTSDIRVAKDKHGAAADRCSVGDREIPYIFYDRAYIATVTKKVGGSSWGAAFVLAHEAAHHVREHTRVGNDWTNNDELAADQVAAMWLAFLGATSQDLENSFNALGLSADAGSEYPSKCERLARVVRGYNAGRSANLPAVSEPACAVCAGQSTARAWYAREAIAAGTPLEASSVIQCGVGAPTQDLPLVFNQDLAGMCAAVQMILGTRLTWNNVDACALISRTFK